MRFSRFLRDAGSKGVGLMTGGLLSFSVSAYEHFKGSSLPAISFTVVGFVAMIAGAYLAWKQADDKYQAEVTKNLEQPDIFIEYEYSEEERPFSVSPSGDRPIVVRNASTTENAWNVKIRPLVTPDGNSKFENGS